MAPILTFGALRFIIVSLAVFAQIYLFVRFLRAIRSSGRSRRFKIIATILAGAAIVSLFAMNGLILSSPVSRMDLSPAAGFVLFYLPAIWVIGSILSALLLLIEEMIGGLCRLIFRSVRNAADETRDVPADPLRRRVLRVGIGGLAAAPFILSGYGAAYAGKAWEVRELTLPFGCPLRLVQLTDIHAGPYMTRREMHRYADEVIALEPDLFVLTGDYVSNSVDFLPGCLEEMARVRARYGTFATLGNHENWVSNLRRLQAIFRQYGIPLLQNSHKVIRTGKGRFAVAGIDDLRSGYPDLEAALLKLDPAIPTILLSHRPEIFPEAASQYIALTLSGHYHGGQIKVSLPEGDFSLAHLRTPYPEGLYRIDDSRLYVSRGIGTTFTPVRLNARPEITVINLT
jgi:predicted MPP superfamily phosphohydrolase